MINCRAADLCRLVLFASVVAHGAPTMTEGEFKAAALFNILQFVQWPDRGLPPENTLRLCQISASGLSPELLQLNGRQVHRHVLAVKRIDGTADDAFQCEAIWVELDRLNALGRMAAVARLRPLLLVGEGAESVDRGAMVGISVDKGRARLRVDNAAARDSGLTIGARLLQFASGGAP